MVPITIICDRQVTQFLPKDYYSVNKDRFQILMLLIVGNAGWISRNRARRAKCKYVVIGRRSHVIPNSWCRCKINTTTGKRVIFMQ